MQPERSAATDAAIKPNRVRGIAGHISWLGRARRLAAVLLAAIAVIGLGGALDLGVTWLWYHPRIEALAHSVPRETEYMRRAAQAGERVTEWHWVALDSIGPVATCAVLAAEDGLFFQHGTLDYGAQRQLVRNLLSGDFSSGGSTIAQQLARNLFLGPDRTPRRKLREYLLAYAITHALSKERQLELYLNLVEWGPGVWGVDAGSRHWFGKPPAELTLSEAVVLASMLPAPGRGLHYTTRQRARDAQESVVETLWEGGVVDAPGRSATTARVRRWADHLAAGRTVREARALVEQEMGPEPRLERYAELERLPVATRCEPNDAADAGGA